MFPLGMNKVPPKEAGMLSVFKGERERADGVELAGRDTVQPEDDGATVSTTPRPGGGLGIAGTGVASSKARVSGSSATLFPNTVNIGKIALKGNKIHVAFSTYSN